MERNVLKRIFENYVLMDSGLDLLEEYINNINEKSDEKYKRLICIKKLSDQKLKTKILDEQTLPALIKECNVIFPIKKKVQKNENSFNDILYEDDGPEDQKFILNNFIYNSSIIYVD